MTTKLFDYEVLDITGTKHIVKATSMDVCSTTTCLYTDEHMHIAHRFYNHNIIYITKKPDLITKPEGLSNVG